MQNLALLTGRLSGRPVLMRAADAESWGRRLMAADPRLSERPKGFAGLLARARAMASVALPVPAEHDGPALFAPSWIDDPDEGGLGWTLSNGVALIGIEGPLIDRGDFWLWSYEALSAAFADALADPRVRAVFAYIDSPGGMAAQGLPDLASQLRATRGQQGRKPIWAYAETACSAAYWIASACDRIVAPAMGTVGSIGAVSTHCDMSGSLANDGIKVTQIKFGAKKTDGSPYEPLSDTAQADWQADIDQLGRMFVNGVVAGRPRLTAEAVIATQAACYMAAHDEPERSGLKLSLVDAIMSERAAFNALVASVSDPITSQPVAATAAVQGVVVHDPRTKEASMADVATRKARLESRLASLSAEAEGKAATTEECPDCGGTGEVDGKECPTCEGTGEVDPSEPQAQTPAPSPKTTAPDAETALAITELSEARGRKALAASLARTVGMTIETARVLLNAAPKASRLDSVPDPDLGDAGASTSEPQSAADFILGAHALATGSKPVAQAA